MSKGCNEHPQQHKQKGVCRQKAKPTCVVFRRHPQAQNRANNNAHGNHYKKGSSVFFHLFLLAIKNGKIDSLIKASLTKEKLLFNEFS